MAIFLWLLSKRIDSPFLCQNGYSRDIVFCPSFGLGGWMDGGGNKEKIESTAMGGFSVARRRRRRDVRFNWAGGSHTRSKGESRREGRIWLRLISDRSI